MAFISFTLIHPHRFLGRQIWTLGIWSCRHHHHRRIVWRHGPILSSTLFRFVVLHRPICFHYKNKFKIHIFSTIIFVYWKLKSINLRSLWLVLANFVEKKLLDWIRNFLGNWCNNSKITDGSGAQCTRCSGEQLGSQHSVEENFVL